jgi:hypothetical protein
MGEILKSPENCYVTRLKQHQIQWDLSWRLQLLQGGAIFERDQMCFEMYTSIGILDNETPTRLRVDWIF